jgi:hypothetical protein
MAAKALDSKSGMVERKEKRISSFRELFFDDFESRKALKGLVSACEWTSDGCDVSLRCSSELGQWLLPSLHACICILRKP